MRLTYLGTSRFAAVVLCAVVTVAMNSCGGDGSPGSSGPAINTPTPTPKATETPGQFTGNFVGTAALDAGQTASVTLNFQSDTSATGTLTISGGQMGDMVIPLTGFVDLTMGNFSLTGGSDFVSGTLPGPGESTGFLAVQIGNNTLPFHGTISAA